MGLFLSITGIEPPNLLKVFLGFVVMVTGLLLMGFACMDAILEKFYGFDSVF